MISNFTQYIKSFGGFVNCMMVYEKIMKTFVCVKFFMLLTIKYDMLNAKKMSGSYGLILNSKNNLI